jgi:hypothetical protein
LSTFCTSTAPTSSLWAEDFRTVSISSTPGSSPASKRRRCLRFATRLSCGPLSVATRGSSAPQRWCSTLRSRRFDAVARRARRSLVARVIRTEGTAF